MDAIKSVDARTIIKKFGWEPCRKALIASGRASPNADSPSNMNPIPKNVRGFSYSNRRTNVNSMPKPSAKVLNLLDEPCGRGW